MKKLIISICALVIWCTCFQGCGQKEKKRITIGFSQIGESSSWRTAETNSIRSEAKNRNIELLVSDSQGKQENQIAALDDFISKKVDVILLAPEVKSGWETVLRRVKAANIPLVLVDRGINGPEELYTTIITADFVHEGRVAAEWLANKMNKKGNVIQLEGTPDSDPAKDRKKGFVEGLSKFPEIKITGSQTAMFNRADGKKVTESFIKSLGKGNIQAVYAHNDDMALGAIQALEEAGIKPSKDVIVISIDGIRDAFTAIVDGKLSATVECTPLYGPKTFEVVDKILKGESVQKRYVNETRLFDQSNAAKEIGNRQY